MSSEQEIEGFIEAVRLVVRFIYPNETEGVGYMNKVLYENMDKNNKIVISNSSYFDNQLWQTIRREIPYYINSKKPYTNRITYHGLCTEWYENGRKLAEYLYEHGKRTGTYLEWHDNGQLRIEATLVNDKEHGTYSEYDRYGVLIHESNYSYGKLHGLCQEWCRYDDRHPLLLEANYKYGKLHGLYRKYDSSSYALVEECIYKNGNIHGMWYAQFCTTNTLWKECKYVHGKKHGTMIIYDSWSHVEAKEVYKKGILVKSYTAEYTVNNELEWIENEI